LLMACYLHPNHVCSIHLIVAVSVSFYFLRPSFSLV
jgi:hypothetical protein